MTKIDDSKTALLSDQAPPPTAGAGSSSSSAQPSFLTPEPYFGNGDGALDDEYSAIVPPADGGDDEAPPQYSDLPEAASPFDPAAPPPHAPPAPAKSFRAAADTSSGNVRYMDPRLDSDPEYLQQWIEHLARYPPRPFIRVKGQHRESTTRQGKTENKTVVDFDVQLELTAFLYRDAKRRLAWNGLRTVEGLEKVRRGTVLRTRAPGFGGKSVIGGGGGGGAIVLGQDEDGGENGYEKATLKEWCHRYCASHAALRTFVLRRRVTGFDEDAVRSRLDRIVRGTGYRGSLDISFPVKGSRASVYSNSKVNEWRLTRWVRWMFYLTLTFLLVWPFLFFGTKRFEVAVAEWEWSRYEDEDESEAGSDARGHQGRRVKKYASVSEDVLLNIWAGGIRKAVTERRQCVLDQGDIGLQEENTSFSFEGLRGGREAVVGTVINAMGAMQRQYGWGGDT